MKIQESAENYLETILILSQKQPFVRSIDIANEMSFSKPSVSIAMKNLKQRELITVGDDGHIALTPEGLVIAAKVYERHTLFITMLTRLGVDPKVAAEDACRIEHVISNESFEAIKAHLHKFK